MFSELKKKRLLEEANFLMHLANFFFFNDICHIVDDNDNLSKRKPVSVKFCRSAWKVLLQVATIYQRKMHEGKKT